MTDALVAFLKARLDDDAQAARRAGDSFRQIGETGVIVATDGDRAEECASANWAGIAEHIVRQDPARTLREVEAKRGLLDLHHMVEDPKEMQDYCAECDLGRDKYPYYPCTTLRILALPYADHPDYLEEWRP